MSLHFSHLTHWAVDVAPVPVRDVPARVRLDAVPPPACALEQEARRRGITVVVVVAAYREPFRVAVELDRLDDTPIVDVTGNM